MQSARHLTVATLAFSMLVAASCSKPEKPASPVADIQAVRVHAVPTDPDDQAWNDVPEFISEMIPQDMVEPRQLDVSTAEVRVKAIADHDNIALRLEWRDTQPDDLNISGRFGDACAIQLPAAIETDVPAPQMGESGRPVEITYWSAAWQAVVDGRGDSIKDIYPNATVDHYPFQARSLEDGSSAQTAMEQRYAPARALGNRMAGPRDTPVQDLIAEGPGTLAPGTPMGSTGAGQRTEEGWCVVIVRPLPAGLTPGRGTQIALAVWDGGRDEVGARKMRTVWIPLSLQDTVTHVTATSKDQ